MSGFAVPIRRMILVLLLAAVAGCGGSQDDETPGPVDIRPVIGVSLSKLDDPFQQQIKTDITAAAKDRTDLKLVFNDAEGDAAKQQAQVRQMIADGVKVIILSLDDKQALTPVVSEAMAREIPVLLLHRRVVGGDYTCLIRVDDEKIGATAGAWIAERFAQRGTIVELKGKSGSRAADARHAGFDKAVKERFRSSFNADMDWNEKDARAAMELALDQHKKIAAVFAHNDRGAHGAYLAAKAVGRQQEMAFVGVGALPKEGIPLIEQGILAASLHHPTGGTEAFKVATDILADKKPPKEIQLPQRILTK